MSKSKRRGKQNKCTCMLIASKQFRHTPLNLADMEGHYSNCRVEQVQRLNKAKQQLNFKPVYRG